MSDLAEHLIKVHKFESADFRWSNLRKIVRIHLKHRNVLDVGCGTGHMTLEMLRSGYNVVAIDISPTLIEFVKKAAEQAGFIIDAKVMDAVDVKQLGNEIFDNIVRLDVLEHIENDVGALKSFYHVLKKRLTNNISTGFKTFIWQKRHRDATFSSL